MGLALLALYIATYCALSALGKYQFTPSGRIRFGDLAISDLQIWQPKSIWFQADFLDIRGETISRGNFLGYFFSPLISLDRLWVHKTVEIEELARIHNRDYQE